MKQNESTETSAAAESPVTYGSYLHLDQLLSLQRPMSAAHDEMLFVIIHQVSELWMKLRLVELGSARTAIAKNQLGHALEMMARLSRIQANLIQSREVLATITPADYNPMRGEFGSGSGFQSRQYRQLEFMQGKNNPALIAIQRDPDTQSILHQALQEPSFFDKAIRLDAAA